LQPYEYGTRRRRDGRLWLALVAVIAVWALLYGLGHACTHKPAKHHHAKALAPPHVKKAFYYNLTPRQGGQACLVGPFIHLNVCRDNLGSAFYSHPLACSEQGWSPTNCRNLDSGYGYPQGAGLHPAWQIPDADCQLIPIIHTGERGKWVRFWFSDVGDCTVVIKGKPAPVLPAGSFTYYADKQCPGWPWIYIGDTGAWNGDGVCG
jgi:hypothetical protein